MLEEAGEVELAVVLEVELKGLLLNVDVMRTAEGREPFVGQNLVGRKAVLRIGGQHSAQKGAQRRMSLVWK